MIDESINKFKCFNELI